MENLSTGNGRGRHSFSGKSSVEDPLNANSSGGKPFGIGELHNLRFEVLFSRGFLTHKNINTKFSTNFLLAFPFVTLKFSFILVFSLRRVETVIFSWYIKNTHKMKCYTFFGF